MSGENLPGPDGRTLADVLRTGTPSSEDAARIGSAIARALARLHRAGLVHRGVSPDTVCVGENTTLSEPVEGTAPYLAPEGAIDGRSDVYALGLVLYRMLAGGLPTEVDPIPPIPIAVPATLEHITRRALQPRPADRYTDVGHIADALDAWLATRVGPTPPPAPAVRSVPRTIGGAASVGIGVVLIAVGVIGIGVGWWSTRTPVEEVVIHRPTAVPPPSGDVVVDGVRFERDHAERALSWVNAASAEELAGAGIYHRAVDVILANRPYDTLEALGDTPGVGPKSVEAVATVTQLIDSGAPPL